MHIIDDVSKNVLFSLTSYICFENAVVTAATFHYNNVMVFPFNLFFFSFKIPPLNYILFEMKDNLIVFPLFVRYQSQIR